MTDSLARLPHAALDPASRWPKAEKIRAMMKLASVPGRQIRLLEIGTGSGAIAHYFATCSELDCEVDAVDVIDQRQIADGYRFQQVKGVELPFVNDMFDAVISNHVLEHVGDSAEQIGHLREIARVLRPTGQGYLASPNRWQVVEPHYHLAFLSWLPRQWRTPYLRLFQGEGVYDCEPLRMKQVEAMLDTAGLQYRNICIPTMRHTIRFEKPKSRLARVAGSLPDSVLNPLRGLCPTHVYLIKRRVEAS